MKIYISENLAKFYHSYKMCFFYYAIYIDGNHNLSNILEDGPHNTVSIFVNACTKDKMELVFLCFNQLILRKK